MFPNQYFPQGFFPHDYFSQFGAPQVAPMCEDLGVLDLSFVVTNGYKFLQRMKDMQTNMEPLLYKILNRTVGANNG